LEAEFIVAVAVQQRRHYLESNNKAACTGGGSIVVGGGNQKGKQWRPRCFIDNKIALTVSGHEHSVLMGIG